MKSSHLALQKMAGKVGAIMIAVGLAVLLFLNYLFLNNENESRYDKLIVYWAKHNDVDPCLIKAIIKRESKFRMRAVGTSGEVGLMQIMMPAVKDWAKATNNEVVSRKELFNPSKNIEIGSWYFANALKQWKNRGKGVPEAYALASYNAGPGNLDKWMKKYGDKGDVMKIIQFPSTRDYVGKILSFYEEYKKEDHFSQADHSCRMADTSR